MLALAADLAGGGAPRRQSRLSTPRHGSPLIEIARVDNKDQAEIAARILKARRDGADLWVDATGGWGIGVRTHLRKHHQTECAGLVFLAKTGARTADGKFGFRNLRAELYWAFREALDPEGGEDIKLPLDPRLMAALTTPRWKPRGDLIVIEEKEDIEKRVGGSVDRADATVMAWYRRLYGVALMRGRDRAPPGGWREHAPDDNLLENW